jgi:hypothetical protein
MLSFQLLDCSAFRTVSDVPSMDVLYSESFERFPYTSSKFFFKLSVAILVAPVITGRMIEFQVLHSLYLYA